MLSAETISWLYLTGFNIFQKYNISFLKFIHIKAKAARIKRGRFKIPSKLRFNLCPKRCRQNIIETWTIFKQQS